MFNVNTQFVTTEILETVISNLYNLSLLPARPSLLYHYTTLETIQKIFEFDDIRLNHAEYSNDHRELSEAKDVIATRIAHAQTSANPRTLAFLQQIDQIYSAQAVALDAYIFCMSTGLSGNSKPQDMLSQWRAYGQDGRGGTLTLDASGLAALVHHLPGSRINPVIYDRATQDALVDGILSDGAARQSRGDPNAVDATVAALVFCTPLMKDPGFTEEQEWRLIYMPLQEGPKPTLGFHPRRDFLAPYLRLQNLWNVLRPALIGTPGVQVRPAPSSISLPTGVPLIPAQGVMIGPSGHQPLNVRAMRKVLDQWRPGLPVDESAIPYRSLG